MTMINTSISREMRMFTTFQMFLVLASISISHSYIISYQAKDFSSVTKSTTKHKSSKQFKLYQSSSSETSFKSKIKPRKYSSYNQSNNNQVEQEISKQINYYGRNGQIEKALQLYENSIKEKKVTTRIMNNMIEAYSRSRIPDKLELALEILNTRPRSSSSNPNVYTFGSLITCCVRSQDPHQALTLLRLMKDKYNVNPNEVCYCSAITSCKFLPYPQSTQRALELLEESLSLPYLQMNIIGYNAVLSIFASSADCKGAIQLFQSIQGPSSKIVADAVTYSTVMSACERAGEWKLVLEYADLMKNDENILFRDGIALTSALHACQALGKADLALKYLQEFKNLQENFHFQSVLQKKKNRAPLIRPDDVAYCLAISACSKEGRLNDAVKLLQEMIDQNIATAEAYTAVIDGCSFIQHNGHDIAFRLLEQMREHNLQPTVFTYSSVITACAASVASTSSGSEKQFILEKAISLFNSMSAEKQINSTVTPNIVTYNAILQVCAEGCQLQKCFEIMNQLNNSTSDLQPNIITYGTLMSACERVRNVTAMEYVFDLMKEDKSHITPNEIVYGAAISCCRKAKQPNKALSLLNEMTTKMNLHPNIATFNTVLRALTAQINNSHRMKKSYIIAIIDSILEIYHKLRDKSTSTSPPNRQTYIILIRTLSQHQRPKDAEEILRHMKLDKSILNQNKQDSINVNMYTDIISAYEKNKQPKQALRLMEEMRKDGYDFYDNAVLNEMFKKLIKIVHWGIVGQESL